MRQKTRVAVGLGSNLGDREKVIRAAARELSEEFLEDVVGSSVYESAPWQGMDQPFYLNAVLVGWSEWKPPAIVNYFKSIERAAGRVSLEKNASRVLDLDLLVYGEKSWESDGIKVPHPHLHMRDFVLAPLNEVWPDWTHPILGETCEQLWTTFQRSESMTAKVVAPPLLSSSNQ